MITFIYIILINSAFAAKNGKTAIYLKGNEGERLISTEDLACGSYNDQAHIASFRLNEEASTRAKKFAEGNRGIKANLIVCGSPFAFHLGSRLNEEGAVVTVPVPKKARKCVTEAVKPLSPCVQP